MHEGKKTRTLSWIVARCRKGLVAVAVLSAAINLLVLGVSLYSTQVFDRVMSSGSLATLGALTVITIAVIVLSGALEVLRGQILSSCGAWLDDRLGAVLLGRLPDRVLSGDAAAAESLADAAALRAFICGPGLVALLDLPWFGLYLALISLMQWQLGLVVGLGAVALLALAVLNAWVTAEPAAESARMAIQLQRRIASSLPGIEAADAMGYADNLTQEWTL